MKKLAALLALAAPAAALAAGPDHVTIVSHAYVEHARPGPGGASVMVREEPKVVTPGDRLVFDLAYRNIGAEPATGFVVTDPVPAAVAFAGDETAGAIFSVDGGRTWGPLAALRVAQPNGGSRSAGFADVTHIRWVFARAIPAGSAGSLSFRGVVK